MVHVHVFQSSDAKIETTLSNVFIGRQVLQRTSFAYQMIVSGIHSI